MNAQKRISLFSLALIAALLVSAILPAAVYADDGTPPEEPSAETGGVDSPPSDEPDTDPATPPEAEGSLSLPEVLEQAPEGTEVAVLDENSELLPLVTEEAAEILMTSDPFWCPAGGGSVPGAGNCTTSYGTFTELLTFLDTNDANAIYQQDGTIYVTSGAYAGGETSIDIDGADYGTMQNYSLTLQGGWNSVTQVVDSTSTFSVPLSINWLGGITLDNINVAATAPGATGANLDTCQYDGGTGLCAGTGDISVTDSQFNGNAFNGLVTDAGGDTSLNNVQANGNGLNGAYITGDDEDGTGNVSVTNGIFSDNNNGTGLDILSDGNITLNNVTANNNNDGAILDTTPGAGNISITGSTFGDDANSLTGNDYTGLNAYSAGNITLNNVDASFNAQDGAYLDARYGTGAISITNNSNFFENSVWGIKAMTGEGDVTLNNVTVDGNDVTGIGAFLKTFGGGDISVSNSTFTRMADVGLLAVSSGGVNLVNLTVTLNGGDGVEVYSTYTYACFGDKGILVNVNGGSYQNNGFYGLKVVPGPEGSLTFVTAPTFGGNGLGDYLLDLADPICKEHKENEETGPVKDYNVVEVPFTGGEPVAQDCEIFAGNILQLPGGNWVQFDCPFDGYNVLAGLNEEDLPGPLGAGADFLAGLSLGLLDPDQAVVTFNKDGTITVTFLIPEGARARGYDILYWDPAANNGQGAWVTLPQRQFGQKPTALNPDDDTDGRRILAGVRRDGKSVSVTVNFTGVFVLVAR